MRKLLGLLLAIAMVFTVGVPVMAEGESAAELDAAALTRSSILTVSSTDATLLDNLNLPKVGANGSTITWTSSDSSVISNEGVVTRPDFTKTVNLTATLNEEVSKVFAFRVLGKNDAIVAGHPVPEKGTLIRKDDFNDGVIDANTITTTGNVTEENGVLHLSGAKNVETSARVFLKEDQSALTGKVIVEYTLKKGGSEALYSGVQIESKPSSGDYGYTYWYNYTFDGDTSNDITNESIALRGGDGYARFAYDAFGTPSTLMKFTVLYDTEAGTYETWINNRYAGKRTRMSASATDIKSIAFMNIGGLSTDATLDDFACYNIKEETVGMVLSDEKFDGATVPSRVEQKGAAAPTVSGGKLNLVSAASETAANIYLNDGKTPMYGKFAVEFSLERTSSSGTLDIYFQDAKGSDAVIIRSWNNGSGVQCNVSKTKGEAYNSSNYSALISGRTDSIDVYAEVDTTAQTVKISVNDIVVTGYTIGGKNNISYIQLYNFAAAELKVDNFKVTSLEENIEDATIIWKDSFSDGTVDTNLMNITGDVAESNGLLNIPDGGNLKRYFNNFVTGITDDFVAEISLKKITADTQYYFYGNNAAGGVSDFARIDWREDLNGVVYVFNGTELKSISGVGTENLHIKMAASIKNQTFSVWINGELVADNVKARNETKDVLYFQADEDASTGVGIDEIFFYSIKEEVPATVSALSLDYNAYDKKVCVLSPVSGNAMVLAASYKEDVLVDVKPVGITLVANGTATVETGLNTTGADKVSVYLWDANGNMIPMCDPNNITGIISAN